MNTSITLLKSPPATLDYVGPACKAAGWYGQTQGLHTVALWVHNFTGRIAIEGSMAAVPTEADWFQITYPSTYSTPYIQYPRANYAQPNPGQPRGETSTIGFSFYTNCLWLRAVVTRSYLSLMNLPTNAGTTTDVLAFYGSIDRIIYNFARAGAS